MRVFQEEQKMNQIWIKVALGIALIVTFIPIVKNWNVISLQSSFVQFKNFLGPIIVLLVFFLIERITLKTRIDEHGISYQYFPFHWTFKTIKWNEIKLTSIRKYNAISEYGGWGIRVGFLTKKGKAFTTCGSIGLQLILKNGKKILIGTHKKEELNKALELYKNKLT